MTLKDLLNNREAIKNRNAQIVVALQDLAKTDPKRADLVGEQTANNLKLKTLNAQIAQANREANGTVGGSGTAPIATVDLSNAGLNKKQIAAMVAMHALVLKFADSVKSPGQVEDRAEDIAEAAWQIADAMFESPSFAEDDKEEEEDQ
jgi:hypothetical protein